MAYDKQTWVSGEVITAVKLNHMEDGIANAGGGSIEAYDFDQAINAEEEYLYGDPITYLSENTPAMLKTFKLGGAALQYLTLSAEVWGIDDEGQPVEKEGGVWSGITFEGDIMQIVIRDGIEVIIRYMDAGTDIRFYYDSATNRWLSNGGGESGGPGGTAL